VLLCYILESGRSDNENMAEDR
jgi:hypothetical protein